VNESETLQSEENTASKKSHRTVVMVLVGVLVGFIALIVLNMR
jgi:hypothetical protein